MYQQQCTYVTGNKHVRFAAKQGRTSQRKIVKGLYRITLSHDDGSRSGADGSQRNAIKILIFAELTKYDSQPVSHFISYSVLFLLPRSVRVVLFNVFAFSLCFAAICVIGAISFLVYEAARYYFVAGKDFYFHSNARLGTISVCIIHLSVFLLCVFFTLPLLLASGYRFGVVLLISFTYFYGFWVRLISSTWVR